MQKKVAIDPFSTSDSPDRFRRRGFSGRMRNCFLELQRWPITTSRNTPSAKFDVPAGAFAAGASKAIAPVSSCPPAFTCAFQAHKLRTLAGALHAINWHQNRRPATKDKKNRRARRRMDFTKPEIKELKQYNSYYAADNAYTASARLLQSKWREKQGYKSGKLGNYLDDDFAKVRKANFITENAKKAVTNAIIEVRKSKGLISEPRIWNNLLSSQPLCFNLFGDLSFDCRMATQFFSALLPGKIDEITSIKFEYSPGRRNLKYLGDNSAFDVFVEYKSQDKQGFIGIEVKYAETLNEETEEKAEKNFKERYAELANSSKRFKDGAMSELKRPPIAQIWRDHLLAIATEQDYEVGLFVFLYPSKNTNCQKAVNNYTRFLTSSNEEISGFYPRHLDDFMISLDKLYNADWTRELIDRYLGQRI